MPMGLENSHPRGVLDAVGAPQLRLRRGLDAFGDHPHVEQ